MPIYDINFAPLNFSNGNQTLISGSSKNAEDAEVLYSNVISIGSVNGVGGQPIDCIVTNDDGTTTFDMNFSGGVSGVSGTLDLDPMFSPQIATNNTIQFRKFKFNFVITDVVNGVNQYTPVILENVVLNIYDIDREGNGNLRNRVLISKDNYNTYEEISTYIALQNASGTQLDIYQGSNAKTNDEADYSEVVTDAHRVRFTFSNLQTLEISLGTENQTGQTTWSGNCNFYLSFAPGTNFGATPVQNDIIVDLNGSAAGVNNTVIVNNNNPFNFTLTGTNIFKATTTTLTGVNVSYPLSGIINRSNETMIINGANGTSLSIPLAFNTAPSPSTFTLLVNSNTVTYNISYTVSINSTGDTINTIGFTESTMDLAKAETLLDALQYKNASIAGNEVGFRNFTVIGTGTFLLNSNPVVINSPPAVFIANIAVPLPVNILSFTGKAIAAGNQLNWTVAQEDNFSHYEVLRSDNGRDFNAVGTVYALNNSLDMKSYSFVDADAKSDLSYYKLRLVDNNGSFAYSSLVVVSRTNIVPTVSSVFPNPASTQLNVELNGVAADNMTVTIQDLTGKILYQAENVSAQSSVYSFDINTLNRGVYIIRIQDEMGQTSVSRFSVSK
jgi:hypothetical protein